MDQPPSPARPGELPDLTYPVIRFASEYFMRGIDLLTPAEDDSLIQNLIFLALVHGQMVEPPVKARSIRALARFLDLPYPTVRRHAQELVRSGRCSVVAGGLAVPSSIRRNRTTTAMLRKIYLNAARLLVDLSRIGFVNLAASALRAPRSRQQVRQQKIITIEATSRLLAAVRLVQDVFQGDVIKGLVYTAIWTANVRHVTGSIETLSTPTVLPDALRLPVSVLAIASSLRLPYETVRRHTDALLRAGTCERLGRRGLIVPARIHQAATPTTARVYEHAAELVANLRRAGVRL